MPKRTPIDKLTQTVSKVLEEYGEEVQDKLDEIVPKLTKKGAQTLRQQSKATFGGTGKYASGWTTQIETGRVSTQGTIYNKTPGLPHLLEYGHALRQGGRTTGRAHIKPVEEALVKEFESKVKKEL